MKPEPKPLKPTTCWALCTRRGTLAHGSLQEILTYRTRKMAAYDRSEKDGERVVKIEIREVKP